MRGSIRPALSAALLLAALLTPGALQGQGGAAPSAPPSVRGDSLVLQLEREVFTYPRLNRRNPFRPLLGEDAGPRFEELELLGVFLSDRADESLALIGIMASAEVRPDSTLGGGGDPGAAGAPSDVEEFVDTRSRTRRLRVGDRWGSVRLVAIERNRVLFDVTEFGLTDRRELILRRPVDGGVR